MKEIKYYCDCCGKEIPYTEMDIMGHKQKMWHFGKLDCLGQNMFLNAEYEICERCAGKINLEFETERLKILAQIGVK